MNDRGFGVVALIGFVALVGLVLAALYMFLVNVLRNIYVTSSNVLNYKNEYIIYMKEHNIKLDK